VKSIRGRPAQAQLKSGPAGHSRRERLLYHHVYTSKISRCFSVSPFFLTDGPFCLAEAVWPRVRDDVN
jgi:hypothetical protein